MSKYVVKGKMIVSFPFEKEVKAENPVEAEEVAVAEMRKSIKNTYCIETTDRPVEVSTRYIGE